MKSKSKFDKYINNYRKTLNRSLSLSGETSNFFAKYKAQKLFEWLPQLSNKKINILDFGCGDGNMTYYVSRLFSQAKIFGIDSSRESVKQASKNHPQIKFKTNNKNIIEFDSNTFDLAYAAGVFHHIKFDQHNKFISEIIRILKPNGYFVLFELNPYNPLTRLTFKRCPIDKDANMLSAKYSKQLLQKHGSTIIKYYCFFPSFLKALRPLEKYLTWFPLGALYACITKK